MNSLQPYGEFRKIDTDLWVLEGEWYDSFHRRMTVIRLRDGGLFLHSPIRLRDEDYLKLEALGRPSIIIAPNAFHTDESGFYRERYPEARLFAPKRCREKLEKAGTAVDETLPWSKDHALWEEIECFEVQGTRMLEESVFFHRSSKTLILTDLMFLITRNPKNALQRVFLQWNQILNRFGVSRIFRWVFVQDKRTVLASLNRIAGWDFVRVIVNHEEIVEGSDVRARFIEGYATLRS